MSNLQDIWNSRNCKKILQTIMHYITTIMTFKEKGFGLWLGLHQTKRCDLEKSFNESA